MIFFISETKHLNEANIVQHLFLIDFNTYFLKIKLIEVFFKIHICISISNLTISTKKLFSDFDWDSIIYVDQFEENWCI